MRRSTIHPPSLLLAEGFRKSTRAQTMGGPALDEEHLRASVDSTDVYCICLYHYIYIYMVTPPPRTNLCSQKHYIYILLYTTLQILQTAETSKSAGVIL